MKKVFLLTDKASTGAFYTVLLVLAGVPLVFSTAVQRIYVTPKLTVLLVGSAIMLILLTFVPLTSTGGVSVPVLLHSRHTVIVVLYCCVMALSTFLGVSPVVSFFGSAENQMGLITRICFLVCFISIVVGVGRSRARFEVILWTMVLTGLAAALYASAQFLGRDPFVSSALYSFESPAGKIVRVNGPLGHSNYFGNFLLYTTPLAAGLALATRGQARRIALMAMAVSTAAVVISGTRGAWLGLLAGFASFAFLESRGSLSKLRAWGGRRVVLGAAAAVLVLGISLWTAYSVPASRGLISRVKLSMSEASAGSGRVLLWRDSMRMVVDLPVIGCGPEGFRKAFLAYKSLDLARLAPQINNENSHNSYLDAAIAHGLAGGALYVAVIASALYLLWSARRQAEPNLKAALTGLMCSLIAVAVHNFFIFDQIPTGLYFFATVALALVARNILADAQSSPPATKKSAGKNRIPTLGWIRIGFAVLIAAAACWYALAGVRSDVEIKQAFGKAAAGDFGGLIRIGNRATQRGDPANHLSFMFAQALTLYIDRTEGRSEFERNRSEAINLAMTQARKSLETTLAPDAVNLLLAYLANVSGDPSRARDYAEAALSWDRYYPNSRSLLSESLLALGDRAGAKREAQLALDIDPALGPARAAMKEARGEVITNDDRLDRARRMIEEGRNPKAARLLLRAIRASGDTCAECHRQLAVIYEERGLPDRAIVEWQAYKGQIKDSAAIAQAESRIEALTQRRP